MTVRDYFRVLRTRWRTALAVVVLSVLVAGLIAIFMPPTYSAKVDIFFTSSDPTTNVADRVAGYAPLVTNDFVTSTVVGQLRLPETADQFAQHITVTSQPNSAVLTAAVQLSDPVQAAAAANAVGNAFIQLFGRLEVPPAPGVLPPVSAKLVQPAALPPAPVWPSALTVVIGLLVGLLLGAAAAGLRGALDPKVRSRDGLDALTGRPCLGVVTTTRSRGDPGIESTSMSSAAEFRRLRTMLRLVDVDGPPRTLAVSSAGVEVSRTTVSVQLASSLTQIQGKVLLIEADLRHPQISHHFGLDTRTGLTSVLARSVPLERAARRCGDAGLWVLPAGTVDDDPGNLLGSPRMAELLAEVREQYDTVVLDVPPLLGDADAVGVASGTDGVVLVVGRGSTRRDDVREAVELLDQVATPVLGTVLAVRSRRRAAQPPAAPPPPPEPSPPAPTSPSGPVRSTSPTPTPRAQPRPGLPDPSETTAETPTRYRSLISLTSPGPGPGSDRGRTESHDDGDAHPDAEDHDQRRARGDAAVPATENGPKA